MAALIFLFLNLVASFLKSKRWGNRAAEDRSLSNLLYLASIWVIPIIVAITFHEAAHDFVAHLLGDETAWRLGRVSFNPLKHIDPVGTILLPGFLLLLPCLPRREFAVAGRRPGRLSLAIAAGFIARCDLAVGGKRSKFRLHFRGAPLDARLRRVPRI